MSTLQTGRSETSPYPDLLSRMDRVLAGQVEPAEIETAPGQDMLERIDQIVDQRMRDSIIWAGGAPERQMVRGEPAAADKAGALAYPQKEPERDGPLMRLGKQTLNIIMSPVEKLRFSTVATEDYAEEADRVERQKVFRKRLEAFDEVVKYDRYGKMRKDVYDPEMFMDLLFEGPRIQKKYPMPEVTHKDLALAELAAERGTLNIEVPEAEGVMEKTIDVGTGLAGFILQLAIFRKLLPARMPARWATPLTFEIENQFNGGQPGAGFVMGATLHGIGSIPAKGAAEVGARTAVESGLFGGIAYVEGADTTETILSMLIPPTFAGYRGLRKKYEKKFRGAKSVDQITGYARQVQAEVARQGREVAARHAELQRFVWQQTEEGLSGLHAKHKGKAADEPASRAIVELVEIRQKELAKKGKTFRDVVEKSTDDLLFKMQDQLTRTSKLDPNDAKRLEYLNKKIAERMAWRKEKPEAKRKVTGKAEPRPAWRKTDLMTQEGANKFADAEPGAARAIVKEFEDAGSVSARGPFGKIAPRGGPDKWTSDERAWFAGFLQAALERPAEKEVEDAGEIAQATGEKGQPAGVDRGPETGLRVRDTEKGREGKEEEGIEATRQQGNKAIAAPGAPGAAEAGEGTPEIAQVERKGEGEGLGSAEISTGEMGAKEPEVKREPGTETGRRGHVREVPPPEAGKRKAVEIKGLKKQIEKIEVEDRATQKKRDLVYKALQQTQRKVVEGVAEKAAEAEQAVGRKGKGVMAKRANARRRVEHEAILADPKFQRLSKRNDAMLGEHYKRREQIDDLEREVLELKRAGEEEALEEYRGIIREYPWYELEKLAEEMSDMPDHLTAMDRVRLDALREVANERLSEQYRRRQEAGPPDAPTEKAREWIEREENKKRKPLKPLAPKVPPKMSKQVAKRAVQRAAERTEPKWELKVVPWEEAYRGQKANDLSTARDSLQRLKNFIASVPEFALDPVFTVFEEGSGENARKALYYQDGGSYIFRRPEAIGIAVPETAKEGDTIRVNVDLLKGDDGLTIKGLTEADQFYAAVPTKEELVEPVEKEKAAEEVEKGDEENLRPTEKGKGGGGGTAFAVADEGQVRIDWTPKEARAEGKIGDRMPLKGVPMPELYQFAKELLGRAPRIKRLRASRLGQFRAIEADVPWQAGDIEIDPRAAEDPKLLAMVLAHEVGHLTDYIPEGTLKRGNILGRIASLRGHLERFMAPFPGAPGPLTEAEKKELRRQAKLELTTGGEIEVDEVIRESTPITPEDVKAIWNHTIGQEINKKLEDYVKRLNAAEKKDIVMQALRGVVPEELQEFAAVREIPTGRKVMRKIEEHTPDAQEVRKRWRELIEEEVRRRQLLDEKVLRRELVDLSQWWTPWDRRRASRSYRKYRDSSRELYAQALSVMLNTPGELELRAPMFFRGFCEYLNRKPEWLDAYIKLQINLNGDADQLGAQRAENLHAMYDRGTDKVRANAAMIQAARLSWREMAEQTVSQYMVNKIAPTKHLEPRLEKRGADEAALQRARDAHYAMDEMFDPNARGVDLLRDMRNYVQKPLQEAGMGDYDIGDYLQMQRVIHDRADKPNPEGWVPEEAQKQLEYMRRNLGDEKYAKLEALARKFHDIAYDMTVEARDVGFYGAKAHAEKIEPHKDTYAAFVIFRHMTEATVGPGIYKQVGTWSENLNPFHGTIMKFWTLARHITVQKAKNKLWEVLKHDFPEDLTVEKLPYGARQMKRNPPPGRKWLYRMNDGQVQVASVPVPIARQFMTHNIGWLDNVGRFLGSREYKIWHPLLVALMPGFQAHNPGRDIQRTAVLLQAEMSRQRARRVRKLVAEGTAKDAAKAQAISDFPQVTTAEVVKEYGKAMGAAIRRAWGQDDPEIEQMYRERALSTPYIDVTSESPTPEAELFEKMLKQHGLMDEEKTRNRVMRHVGGLLEGLEDVGIIQEAAMKVAVFRILGKRGITGQERAMIVRKKGGTPDWKQYGLATSITNTVKMYSKVKWNSWEQEKDAAFNKDTAAAYWWYRVRWTLLPALMKKAALWGAFGVTIQAMYEAISSYFRDNYDAIPLGTIKGPGDDEGKVVVLTLPQDDAGKVMGNIISAGLDAMAELAGKHTTRGSAENAAKDMLFESVGEFLGTTGPPFEIVSKWAQYAMGSNPTDPFFREPIVPEADYEVGGWDSARRMLSWTADKFGVLSQIAHPLLEPVLGGPFGEDDESYAETVIKGAPWLSRLLRVTDRGRSEMEWAELERDDAERERFRLGLPSKVRRMTSEHFKLRRLGKERLSERDDIRRRRLNHWYGQVYLPLTKKIKVAKEAGNAEGEKKFRDRLDELTRRYEEREAKDE